MRTISFMFDLNVVITYCEYFLFCPQKYKTFQKLKQKKGEKMFFLAKYLEDNDQWGLSDQKDHEILGTESEGQAV